MTHLFLFTLGPVQSFIAQARKTQDLYAGSRLLSVLTETAMNHVKSKNGQITFPDSTIESKPNRFVAKIDLPAEQLKQLGEDVEQAVQAKWKSLAEKMLEKEGMRDPSGFYEQIQQHLKIHWVFHPIQNDYKTAFQQLEGLLAAVKQTNDFEQFPEVGRKCSVDGQLNVKFYRPLDGDTVDKAQDKLYNKDNYIVDNKKTSFAILQPGEGLSAVSFVKRAYRKGNRKEEFESTADIALLHWQKEHLAAFKNYQSLFFYKDESYFNAQFLFEENLVKKQLEKQGLPKELIKEKLPEFLHKQRKLEGFEKKSCKYYALLLFDGDGMGKLLGGDYLKDDNKLEDFHKAFSKKLGVFAKEAKTHLDDTQFARGRTVYAGGDDFLGFVNLESLFDVLIEFRRLYDDKVNKNDSVKKFLKEDTEITFSAGICIAHYKEPLSLVLNRARAMEQKAKDFRKAKNAFAIGVIKGSGEDHDTVWGFEDDSVTKLKFLVDAMRGTDANFSNTFIKNFQVELNRMLDPKGNINVDMEMLRTELSRLMLRSINSKFKKEEKQALKDELLTKIWDQLFIKQQTHSSLQNFFELLNICDFLHRTLNPVKEKTNAESTN